MLVSRFARLWVDSTKRTRLAPASKCSVFRRQRLASVSHGQGRAGCHGCAPPQKRAAITSKGRMFHNKLCVAKTNPFSGKHPLQKLDGVEAPAPESPGAGFAPARVRH